MKSTVSATRVAELLDTGSKRVRVVTEVPQYEGKAEALFVVELASGMAAQHGLKLGDTLGF